MECPATSPRVCGSARTTSDTATIAAKETAAIATRRRACRLSGITATSEPKLIRTPGAGEGGYVSPPDGAARLDPGTPRVARAVEGARCLRGRGAARRAHARPRLRPGRLEPDGRGGGTGVRGGVAPRARQARAPPAGARGGDRRVGGAARGGELGEGGTGRGPARRRPGRGAAPGHPDRVGILRRPARSRRGVPEMGARHLGAVQRAGRERL